MQFYSIRVTVLAIAYNEIQGHIMAITRDRGLLHILLVSSGGWKVLARVLAGQWPPVGTDLKSFLQVWKDLARPNY